MRYRISTVAIVVIAAAAIVAVGPVPAAAAPMQMAQASQPAGPAQPGRAQRFREKTKESWAQMKRRWSMQREKYAACRKEARGQRLVGQKTRHFLEECMTR
jgi:hypothetical protein